MRRAALFVMLVAMLSGCARIPKPTVHVFSTQQKLEAAEHWRELAEVAVKNLPAAQENPLYISRDDRSPFGQSFSMFLRHEAMLKGIPLTTNKEGATVLDWGVTIVRHEAVRTAPAVYPGQFTLLSALGLGAGYYLSSNDPISPSVLAGGLALDLISTYNQSNIEPTNTELIINITTARHDTLTSNFLAVYYINPEDKGHYWERPAFWARPETLPTRGYRVVSE